MNSNRASRALATRPGVRFLFSLLVSGSLGFAAAASAGWTRHSPIECMALNPADFIFRGKAFNVSSGPKFLACPVLDQEGRAANTITGINVWGFDNNTTQSFSVQVCTIEPNGGHATCERNGGVPDPSATGPVMQSHGVDRWRRFPAAFKYFSVDVPGMSGLAISTVNGFTTF